MAVWATGTRPSSQRSVPGARENYVALGDSYASGEGNPPYDSGTDVKKNRCHRSPKAYSHILAAEHGWPLGAEDFMACSGATRENVLSGSPKNYEGTQLVPERLTPLTSLVTITIGGNDVDFRNVLQACTTGKMLHGSSDCRNSQVVDPNNPSGPKITLDQRQEVLINSLGEDRHCEGESGCSPTVSLHELYFRIADLAPRAEIYVMLYPHLFTSGLDTSSCGVYYGVTSANVSRTNIDWTDDGVDQLDAKIQSEVDFARGQGVRISTVDPRRVFDDPGTRQGVGHGVCSPDPWINEVSRDGWASTAPASESLHPNSEGQRAFADLLNLARTGR